MNPYDAQSSEPNFWLSCLLIDKDAMCRQTRGSNAASYLPESGKSCPTEILETLAKYNAEGRPIWKPMHAQPIFAGNAFVTRDGCQRFEPGVEAPSTDVGMDIFTRGLCLPSDNKMTPKQQTQVIEIVKECFR